jgi:hypothetical protein
MAKTAATSPFNKEALLKRFSINSKYILTHKAPLSLIKSLRKGILGKQWLIITTRNNIKAVVIKNPPSYTQLQLYLNYT